MADNQAASVLVDNREVEHLIKVSSVAVNQAGRLADNLSEEEEHLVKVNLEAVLADSQVDRLVDNLPEVPLIGVSLEVTLEVHHRYVDLVVHLNRT